MDRLSTVHDAIQESILDAREGEELKPSSYKIQPSVKEKAEQICEQNGTSLSAFMRWCCILLVEDYHPESARKKVPVLAEGVLTPGLRGD